MDQQTTESLTQQIAINESHYQYEHFQLQMESIHHSAITLCEIHDSLTHISSVTFSQEVDQGYRLAIQHLITDPFSLEINKADNLSSHLGSSLYEGTKKILKELWEAIKNLFFKALRAARDFFSQLLQGVDGLERALDNQEKRLQDLGDHASKTAQAMEGIDISGGSRIHMGDEINGEDLVKGLHNLHSVTDNITSFYLGSSREILDSLKSVSKDLSKIDAKGQDKQTDQIKEDIRKLKEQPVILFNTLKEEIRDRRDMELPGGMRIKIEEVQFSSRGIPTTMPRIDLQSFESDTRHKEIDQAQVLELDEIKELIKRLRVLLQQIRTGQQQIASISDDYETTLETKDRIFKRQEVVEAIEEHFAEHEKAIMMSMYRMGLPDQSLTKTYRYMYGVARASIHYIKKSLNHYR